MTTQTDSTERKAPESMSLEGYGDGWKGLPIEAIVDERVILKGPSNIERQTNPLVEPLDNNFTEELN